MIRSQVLVALSHHGTHFQIQVKAFSTGKEGNALAGKARILQRADGGVSIGFAGDDSADAVMRSSSGDCRVAIALDFGCRPIRID